MHALSAALRPDYDNLIKLLPAAQRIGLYEPPDVTLLAERLAAHVLHFMESWTVNYKYLVTGYSAVIRAPHRLSGVPNAYGATLDEALLAALIRRSEEMPRVLLAVKQRAAAAQAQTEARDAFARVCTAVQRPEGVCTRAFATLARIVGTGAFECRDDVVSGPHAVHLRMDAPIAKLSDRLKATAYVEHVTVGEVRRMEKAGFVTVETLPGKGFGRSSRNGARLTLTTHVRDALLAEGLIDPA